MTPTIPTIADTARFSFSEAAKLLGMSRPTFYKKVAQGWIKEHRYRDNKRPFVYGADIKYYFRRIAI